MTSLRDLLANPEQPIALAAELTYRDPDTDVVSTVRIWDGLKRRSEVPAGDLWDLLIDPGDRVVSVEGDELSGIGESSAAPMTFANDPDALGAAGPLDFLRTKTLARRAVTLLAGAPDEPIGNYEPVGSGVVDGEPEFDDTRNLMTLRLKSTLDLLDQDLDVRSYVGEPVALRFLTTTGRASTANNAAHHLTSFTICGRFLINGAGASAQRLTSRETASTAMNWRIFMLSSGLVRAIYSSGGVASALLLTSTDAYDDGSDHWLAFVRRSGHAYLMVDGVVVGESTTPATPDLPTSGIVMGSSFPGIWQDDMRILNHYITPDEARAWMAVRASGDEDGLVGLWRGDDALGATLTDYSPIGVNAAIAGVENTDYEWVSSDLGSEELAGQSMPATIGVPYNLEADEVSALFERWRYRDRALPAPGGSADPSPIVRAEGEVLTETADYTDEGNGVVALVSPSPIITCGVGDTAVGAPYAWTFPGEALYDLLSTYALVPDAEIDLDSLDRLSMIYPHRTGWAFRKAKSAEVVGDYVRGLGGYMTRDLDGRMRFDILRPPVSPGPRGGACIEFLAQSDTAINFGDVGAVPFPSSFTIAAWIRTQRLDTNTTLESISNTTIQEVIIDKTGLGAGAGKDYGFGTSGFTARGLVLWGNGVKTLNTPVLAQSVPGSWQFVAGVNDVPNDKVEFYWCPAAGGTVTKVGEIAGALFVDETSEDVIIGSPHNLGSVSEVSVWKKALSLAEIQAIADDAPVGTETDLVFYAPLSEGSGPPVDLVSAASGAMAGSSWRPDLAIDLTLDPRGNSSRSLRPAKSIEVGWRKNFRPYTLGELAGTLTAQERQDLQKEMRARPAPKPSVAEDYLDARDVQVTSPFVTSRGAGALLRQLLYRYGEGREAVVMPDAGRRAVPLKIGDELRLDGYGHLADGKTYRLTRIGSSPGNLAAELWGWR